MAGGERIRFILTDKTLTVQYFIEFGRKLAETGVDLNTPVELVKDDESESFIVPLDGPVRREVRVKPQTVRVRIKKKEVEDGSGTQQPEEGS